MKKVFIRPMAALMLLLPLVSCSDSETGKIGDEELETAKKIALSRAQLEDVDDLTDFSFRLYDRAASKEHSDSNLSISPLGVSMLLGMMANGVEGESREELLKAMLGKEDADVDELNILMSKLIKELPSVDRKVDVKLANSLWYQNRINPTDGFRKAMSDFYEADVTLVDLKTEWSVINEWSNEVTSGAVPVVYSDILQKYGYDKHSFLSYSLICFDGRWSKPFDKSETRPAEFFNADGTVSIVEMMDDSRSGYSIVATDDYYSVSRPYGNGSFVIDLILPAEGKTVADVRARFANEGWESNFRKLSRSESSRDAGIRIPKFDISGSCDVTDVLKKDFGVDKLFVESDDFFPLASASTRLGYIGQSVSITFDEEGTKFTSVTQTGVDVAYVPGKVLEFNSPFMYVIYELSTGAVLLIGTVNSL